MGFFEGFIVVMVLGDGLWWGETGHQRSSTHPGSQETELNSFNQPTNSQKIKIPTSEKQRDYHPVLVSLKFWGPQCLLWPCDLRVWTWFKGVGFHQVPGLQMKLGISKFLHVAVVTRSRNSRFYSSMSSIPVPHCQCLVEKSNMAVQCSSKLWKKGMHHDYYQWFHYQILCLHW